MTVVQVQTIWPRQDSGSTAGGDKPSNVPTILGIVGTMMGLSTICVFLRIYVRGVMIKMFGLDDGVIVLAFLAAMGSMMCLVAETKYGAGRHFSDITLDEFSQLSYWQYIHGPLLVSGISLVKISLGFFLLRFVQGLWYKRFIIFMIVMNIITDAVFLLLPVPVIVGLQVNKRTKASLLFILSLGSFACVASIVRVYVGSHLFQDFDYTWAYAFFIWNYAELHTAIIAACLPALRPLFASMLENTSRRLRATGYMYGSSRYANKYGPKSNNRSGYHRQEDAVGLESLRRINHLEDGTYKARVTSASVTGVSRDDDSSENGILPPKGAVVKTTQIVVSEGGPRV
ncbi:hypothetical protein SCUP515_03123 [Seiridium cupressi]